MAPKIAHIVIHKSFLLIIIFQSVACLSIEKDTISTGVVIKDPQTIVSQNQIFKLGFFTPPNTTNRYLGIFFTFSQETVIWVANRNKPLKDSSGSVTLSRDGNIVVLDGTNQTVWSTNLTLTSPVNLIVQILDTGNLVFREEATGDVLWESFSQPTDVLVQGMTLSQNVKTGKQVVLTAWKNATAPAIGSFTVGLDVMSGTPQLFVWNEGRPHWRSGPWNGLIFLGIKQLYDTYLDGVNHVKNDGAGNFGFSPPQNNKHITATVNSSGSLIRKTWNGVDKKWYILRAYPENECDVYGKCGPFGSCNIMQSPICSCLRGFEPVNEDEWERGNWTNGCRRRNQLQCGDDGFERLRYMKAWKLWSEGNGLSFVEESIASRDREEEMVRCIQIGLLCVQEYPKDRPSIEIVLSMLSSDIVELPVPKQPVFAENGSTQQNVYSNNGLTLSVLEGR